MLSKSLSVRIGIGIAACLSVSCGIGPFSRKNPELSTSNTGDGEKKSGEFGSSPKMTLLVDRKTSEVPRTRLNLMSGLENASSLQLANGTDQVTPPNEGVKATDKITITSATFSISAVKVKKNAEKTEEEQDAEDDEKSEDSGILAKIMSIVAAAKDGDTDELFENLKQLDKGLLDKIAAKDGSVKYKGPFLYDAVKNTMTPSLPEMTLDEGAYRRIDFMFSRFFSEERRSNLDRKAYRIEGTFADSSGQVRPFVIEDHHSMKFSLTSNAEFIAEPLKLNNVVIQFDLTQWFQGIDLGDTKTRKNGLIEINSRRNRSLLRAFNANLQRSAKFAVSSSSTDTGTGTGTSTGTSSGTSTGTSSGTNTSTGTGTDTDTGSPGDTDPDEDDSEDNA
jgi:hypothetical protein